jgi:hypothetical protein
VEGLLVPYAIIDGGNGLNIIFVETLKKMDFNFKRITTCDEPLYNIVPGKMAYPLGWISHPVTFGIEDNFCTEYLNFEVADFKSSYHAFLGRLLLARFMAIPHYTYLVLKMPTPNGVLSVYGDLMVSFKCDSEALDLTATTTCTNTSAVLEVKAAKVAPSDLHVPKQQHTNTVIDATPLIKRVCLGLPNPEKMVVISDDLKEK